MKKFIFTLFFILISFYSFPQANKLGSWYAYVGTYDVAPRWNLQLISQARFYNIMGEWSQFMVRTAANYKLTKDGQYIAGMGLDYFYNAKYIGNTDQKDEYIEKRIYEQFMISSRYNRFNLLHRYRLEDRFAQNQDLKFRFRYLLQVKMALNMKRIQPGNLYLSLVNEAYWNLQGPNLFDRHLLQFTLGYQLNNHLTFEVGNQTQFTGNGNYFHRLQFWVFHKMNWQKKAANCVDE